MRAAILRDIGKDMDICDDVTTTDVGPGEVRVKIHATGVCHSDLSLQNGTIPHALPAIPGHEGAGEIIEVGPGVGNLTVGDRVIIAWVPPCGNCKVCISGQPYLCTQISMGSALMPRFRLGDEMITGMAGTGTFAEEMVVASQAAIPFPDDVPMDVAALVGCGVMTGAGAAINTTRVTPDRRSSSSDVAVSESASSREPGLRGPPKSWRSTCSSPSSNKHCVSAQRTSPPLTRS